MSTLTKAQQETVSQLFSTSDSKVLKAIEDLREIGDENTLQPMLDLLISTNSEPIREEIFRCLNELKSQKSLPILIKALQNERFAIYQSELLQSLWESGLNCKAYFPLFIELAIKEDFMVALEATTVVEAMNPPYNDKELDEAINQLETSLILEDTMKADLLKSLAELIKNMKQENSDWQGTEEL